MLTKRAVIIFTVVLAFWLTNLSSASAAKQFKYLHYENFDTVALSGSLDTNSWQKYQWTGTDSTDVPSQSPSVLGDTRLLFWVNNVTTISYVEDTISLSFVSNDDTIFFSVTLDSQADNASASAGGSQIRFQMMYWRAGATLQGGASSDGWRYFDNPPGTMRDTGYMVTFNQVTRVIDLKKSTGSGGSAPLAGGVNTYTLGTTDTIIRVTAQMSYGGWHRIQIDTSSGIGGRDTGSTFLTGQDNQYTSGPAATDTITSTPHVGVVGYYVTNAFLRQFAVDNWAVGITDTVPVVAANPVVSSQPKSNPAVLGILTGASGMMY